ncbi:MAG TPA: polyprenol monophosphomannose synthase [Actinomycetaceae bacterium]|nr:polyprenol monophosphomannose synthase [Actinomycetaceae bacterium]
MRTLVIIPTYNERRALPDTVRRLRAAAPAVDVLIADDNSPDGTGALADELAAADSHVSVLHREGKEGLGPAYLAGFAWALERGYELVAEMDADGSHQPEQLPALLAAIGQDDDLDLVIGSRWVGGGEVVNWPWHRQALSRGANTYVRVLLGMPVRDATAGFRIYRARRLASLSLDDVASQGYCFQVDMTWRVVREGAGVREVPISFVEREVGESKMSRRIIVEALARTTSWGLAHRAGQLRRLLRRR